MIIKYQDFIIEKLGFKNYKDFILLIGPPGIGKSFYTKKLNKSYDIFNRDDIVSEIFEKDGLSYKDSFSRPNFVFSKNRDYFIPEETDFYIVGNKKYLKEYENLGEVIELPENSYMRRWSDEGFSKVMEKNEIIQKTFNERLNLSLNAKHNVVINMTNMTKDNRKDIINKLGPNDRFYKVKAVVFNNGGQGMEDIIIDINKKRDLELIKTKREKNIPDDVIKNFITRYEEPSKDEGIDEIIFVDTRKDLEKMSKQM